MENEFQHRPYQASSGGNVFTQNHENQSLNINF